MAVGEKIENGDVGMPTETNIYDRCHYDQVLAVSGLLEIMIAPSHFTKIVKSLFAKRCLSEEITKQIFLNITSGNQNGYTNAWRLFFAHLAAFSDSWYWELMSLLSGTAEDMDVRDQINPQFEDELKARETTLQLENSTDATNGTENGGWGSPQMNAILAEIAEDAVLHILEINQSFEEWLDNGEIAQPASLDESYESDDSDEDDSLPAEQLRLRSYQLELATPANNGRNTIVVAPTGSGKTLVAVDIIRHHLESAPRDGIRRKAAFLVPTVHLIEQQSSVLKKYLRSSYKVKGIKGGQVGRRQLPKALSVRSNDVVVMTPQILLNMMIDPSPNVDPLGLDVFTLLVFDECHHAAKSHPYNEIMVKYLDAKFAPATSSADINSPQVVGLTASLGIGRADTDTGARANVLKVCANMDTEVLSTVMQHMDELAQYVSVPVDELIQTRTPHRTRTPHQTHPFSVHVINLMIKIERDFLVPMFDKLAGDESNQDRSKFTDVKTPKEKYSTDYRSWICAWRHELPVSCDVEAKQTMITALEHLEVYHNALFLNGHVPAFQALMYLKGKLSELERRQASDIDRRLIRLYKEELLPHFNVGVMQNAKNEMAETLKGILVREFETKPDGRALVFVGTRELTIALVEYMNKEPDLQPLRATRLTGVQASKEKGGQSAKEQLDVLDKFRSGYHRVLVVTSVAEEGLDVEQCNLIVKYNHVTNEVAMVQRRGRGRAAGSRSILISQGGCEEQEVVNLIKEKMMISAVKHIRDMGAGWFHGEVAKYQRQAYDDRQVKKAQMEQKRKSFEGKTYDLLCKKCDVFMICSTHVRQAVQSYYVGADPSLWDRVHADADDLPKLYENMVQAGRIYCVNCRTECGCIIKYVGVYLPGLKADAFVQQCREGVKQRHHVRKWKKVTDDLFVVDPVDRHDLRAMFDALKSAATLKKLEERIQFAERQLEEQKRKEQMENEKRP